jgi:hypothetical protein
VGFDFAGEEEIGVALVFSHDFGREGREVVSD